MNPTDAPESTPWRVFISSTVEDLSTYRMVARDAAITCELLPIMMEYFTPSGERAPLQACLAKVAAADLLVVIVGARYGWIPQEQLAADQKSITWLECEHAVNLGKEVIP